MGADTFDKVLAKSFPRSHSSARAPPLSAGRAGPGESARRRASPRRRLRRRRRGPGAPPGARGPHRLGPVTAAAFLAAIDDVGRFPHTHQLETYLGLVPRIVGDIIAGTGYSLPSSDLYRLWLWPHPLPDQPRAGIDDPQTLVPGNASRPGARSTCPTTSTSSRFNRRTSKARGLLFYRLVTQAARAPHVGTDTLFRATGRGRPSRGEVNHEGIANMNDLRRRGPLPWCPVNLT